MTAVHENGLHEHGALHHTPLEHTALQHTALRHTVETIAAEIGRIVAERQELRAASASAEVLEANRRRLADAQAELSRLLIARYLGGRDAA